jgi:hypothetical protein
MTCGPTKETFFIFYWKEGLMSERKRDLVEFNVEHANYVKSAFITHLEVVNSDSSTEEQRKSAYWEIFSRNGDFVEAMFLLQLSITLQAQQEAFVRALLKGKDVGVELLNAIKEVKRQKSSE